jgi:uncharacterized protein
MNITQVLANELEAKPSQIDAAIKLLDEGATVPFIARYRKEATAGLSDTQLRSLEERLVYLRELNERRQFILASINEQGKLTPELARHIQTADNKPALEDLYLPYKPKRRTKAQLAIEAGLEPLALGLLADPSLVPQEFAKQFIASEKGIADVAQALEGARHILMEQFAQDAELLGYLRDYVWQRAVLRSEVVKDKQEQGKKFADYFDYTEAIHKIPSHRALALLRGRNEEVLRLNLSLDEIEQRYCQERIARQFNIVPDKRPADSWLEETVAWTWRIKILVKVELELMLRLREQAEIEAIKVFANNLKYLLLASPAGNKVTLGLDPGLRTGVKAVVVDATGKLLEYATIYPHAPRNDWQGALLTLAKLCSKHQVQLISIGNGTASRETDKLVSELLQRYSDITPHKVMVSEAGASVYSASELAANEFPDLDVSYRGAVSIARRLQDPLAELVKIEPKAIGVGQYQHDVNQLRLGRSLNAVVEDCVNAVGVDLNTASAQLLKSVAGLNETLAKNIVLYREAHGMFNSRQDLQKVPRLGAKTFEQAAGFLRICQGCNPLDASGVHPESYSVVERILATLQKPLTAVMGNTALLRSLKPSDFIDEKFGLPTVSDILSELEKPGRDPRPEFKTAQFKEGVETLADLAPGMLLEGVVTNVANFGAFVDIGVHQDGLVHLSMLADRYVKHPDEVVKVGDIVKVKVLEVDAARKRISLSMKLEQAPMVKLTKPVLKAQHTALGSALQSALKRTT